MSENDRSALRRRAEELAEKNWPEDAPVSGMELRELVHEMNVHKIELELQNESLLESQHNLETARDAFFQLFHHAPAGYVVLDRDGIIFQANQTFADMTGYHSQELVFRPFSSFIAPEGALLFNSRFRSFFSSPGGKVMEVPVQGAGKRRYCRLQGSHESFGLFQGARRHETAERLFLIVTDITDRVNAEMRMSRSESQLMAFFASIQDAVFLKDSNCRYVKYNRAMCALTPVTAENLAEMDDLNLFPYEIAQAMLRDDQRTLSGHTVRAEYILPGSDREIVVEAIKTPVRDQAGAITGLCGCIRDITVQKQQELALREALNAAENAFRAKTDFLSNMSHELRTPLNGIMGMLQLLQSPELNGEQADFLEDALAACRRLSDLVNGILDMSLLETGQYQPAPAAFDPWDTLRALEHLFTPIVKKKGLTLSLDVAPDLPHELHGDAIRLMQILDNLAGNAVKYTEQGDVTIQAFPVPGLRNGLMRLIFVIKDTGIGIPDDVQQRLFVPFGPGETGYRRRFQGAGLGLYMVKRLVQAMEGSVELCSEPGVGTEIYLSLPFRTPGEDGSDPQD